MTIPRLALRYATGRWVNVAAVLAVAAALAVQIVSMAVLDGMIEGLRRRFLGLGEQVVLYTESLAPVEGADGQWRWRRDFPARGPLTHVAQTLEQLPGVRAVTPYAQNPVYIDHDGRSQYAMMRGIDLAREARASELPRHLLQLRLDPEAPAWRGPDTAASDKAPLFMGAQLAEALGVKPGDEVALHSGYQAEDGQLKAQRKVFVVTSLFRTGWPDKDYSAVYVPIEDAMDLYWRDAIGPDAGTKATGLSVFLHDPERAEDVAPELEQAALQALGAAYPDIQIRSDTWTDRLGSMVEGMKHENRLMEFVLALYNLAGGLCVFAILSTLVSRRVRDIGLLRCLGAGRGQMLAAFVLVGGLLGATGAVAGVGLGLYASGPLERQDGPGGEWRLVGGGMLTADDGYGGETERPRLDRWHEALLGEPLYPPRMFGVSGGLPMVVYPLKLAVYALAAVMIAMLAALYPAAWAATREPAAALRDE